MGFELLGIQFSFALQLKPFFILLIAIVGTILFTGYKAIMWWIKKGR